MRQLYEAVRERDETELLVRSVKQKQEVGMISPTDVELAATRLRRAQGRVEDLQHLAGGGVSGVTGGRGSAIGRSVMDSTFSIALGETVVIGTSRLKGDQALIALLTAAATPGASR